MSRLVAVLRPEPGNAVTAQRVEAAGLAAIRLPLFAVRALDWAAPDPEAFDALILTSANAPRLAGPKLDAFAGLPLFAVGPATAAASRARGLTVEEVGNGNGAALIATMAARGFKRGLLLAGRDRSLDEGGIIARSIAVYAADPVPIGAHDIAALKDSVALVHSVRAAKRLAILVGDLRTSIRLATISPAVAEAARSGWAVVAAADSPDDETLVALAKRLAD